MNHAGGGGKKPPKKTSRLRDFESDRAPGGSGWQECDLELWASVGWLVDNGMGVFLGRTSDGGALTATLLDDGDKVRWYDNPKGMTERFVALRDELDTSPRNT